MDLSSGAEALPMGPSIINATPKGSNLQEMFTPLFACLRDIECKPPRHFVTFVVVIEALQFIAMGLHPAHTWGTAMSFVSNGLYVTHLPLWDSTSSFGVSEVGRYMLMWGCLIPLGGVLVVFGLLYTSKLELRDALILYKLVFFIFGTVLYIPAMNVFISVMLVRHRDKAVDWGSVLHFLFGLIGALAISFIAVMVNLFQYDTNPRSLNRFARAHSMCDIAHLGCKIVLCVLMQVFLLKGTPEYLPICVGCVCMVLGFVWAIYFPYFSQQMTFWRVWGAWLSTLCAVCVAVSNEVNDPSVNYDIVVFSLLGVLGTVFIGKVYDFRVSRAFKRNLNDFRYKSTQFLPDLCLPLGLSKAPTETTIDEDMTERAKKAPNFSCPLVGKIFIETDVELCVRFMGLYYHYFGFPPTPLMEDYALRIFLRGMKTFPDSTHIRLSYAMHMFYFRKRFGDCAAALDKLPNQDCYLMERYQIFKLSQMLKSDSSQMGQYSTAKVQHREALKCKVEFWEQLLEQDVDPVALDTCAKNLSATTQVSIKNYLHALRLENKDKQVHKSDIRMMIHYGMFFENVLMNSDLAERCYTVCSDLLKSRETRALRGAKKAADNGGIESIPNFYEVQNTMDSGDTTKGSGTRAIRQAGNMLHVVFTLLIVLVSGFLILSFVMSSERTKIINSASALGRMHSSVMHAVAVSQDISASVPAGGVMAGDQRYAKIDELLASSHANLNSITIGDVVPKYDRLTTLLKSEQIMIVDGVDDTVSLPSNKNLFAAIPFYATARTITYRTIEMLYTFAAAKIDSSSAPEVLGLFESRFAFLHSVAASQLSDTLNRSSELYEEWDDSNRETFRILFMLLFLFGLFLVAAVFVELIGKFYDVEQTKRTIRHTVNVIPKEDVATFYNETVVALQRFDALGGKPEMLLARTDLCQEVTEGSEPAQWDMGMYSSNIPAALNVDPDETTNQEANKNTKNNKSNNKTNDKTNENDKNDNDNKNTDNNKTNDTTNNKTTTNTNNNKAITTTNNKNKNNATLTNNTNSTSTTNNNNNNTTNNNNNNNNDNGNPSNSKRSQQASVQALNTLLLMLFIIVAALTLGIVQHFIVEDVTTVASRLETVRLIRQVGISSSNARFLSVAFINHPEDEVTYARFLTEAERLVEEMKYKQSFFSSLKYDLSHPLVGKLANVFQDTKLFLHMTKIAMRLSVEGAMQEDPGFFATLRESRKVKRAVKEKLRPLGYDSLMQLMWDGMEFETFSHRTEFAKAPPYGKLVNTTFDISNSPKQLARSLIFSDTMMQLMDSMSHYWVDLAFFIALDVRDIVEDKTDLSSTLLWAQIILLVFFVFLSLQLLASPTMQTVSKDVWFRPVLLVVVAAMGFVVVATVISMDRVKVSVVSERSNCLLVTSEFEPAIVESFAVAAAFVETGDVTYLARYTEVQPRVAQLQRHIEGHLLDGDHMEGFAKFENMLRLWDIAVSVAVESYEVPDRLRSGYVVLNWGSDVKKLLGTKAFLYGQEAYPLTNRVDDIAKGAAHLKECARTLLHAPYIMYAVEEYLGVQVKEDLAQLPSCDPGPAEDLHSEMQFRHTGVIVGCCVILCLLGFTCLLFFAKKRSQNDSNMKMPMKTQSMHALVRKMAVAFVVVLVLLTGVFLLCYHTIDISRDGVSRVTTAAEREWLSAKAMILIHEMKGALQSTAGARHSFENLQGKLAIVIQQLEASQYALYFHKPWKGRDSFNGVGIDTVQDQLLFSENAGIPNRYGPTCAGTPLEESTGQLKFGLESMMHRWIRLHTEFTTVDMTDVLLIGRLELEIGTMFPTLMDALAYSTHLYQKASESKAREVNLWVLVAVLVASLLILLDFFAVFRPIMAELVADDNTTKQILRLLPQSMTEGAFDTDNDLRANRDMHMGDEVLQMSPYPLITVDHNGIILKFSNNAIREHFGYSPLELAGANVNILMPPDDAKNHEKYLANYRRTGIKKIIDQKRTLTARRKSGKEFPCEILVRTFKCAGEDIFIGYFRSLRQEHHLQALTRRNVTVRDLNRDGIIVIDTMGIVQTANPASKEMFEYDDKSAESTLVGQNIKCLMPYEVSSRHDEYLAAFLRTRVKKMIGNVRRAVGQRRYGECFPVEAQIEEINSEPRFYLGYLKDVSDAARLEEVCKTNDIIANVSTLAIVTMTEMGMVTRFSLAAEKMFGITEASLLGKNVKGLMPMTVAAQHDGYLETYRRTKLKHVIGSTRESVARKNDGTNFPVKLGVAEIDQPRRLTFVAFLEDLTQQRNIEVQRKVAEKVNLASPNGFATITTDGTILSVNNELLRLFCLNKPSQVVGKNVKLLMPESIAEKHDGYLANYLKTGVKAVIDSSRNASGVRSNGQEFPLRISVTEIKSARRTLYIGFIESAEEAIQVMQGQQLNMASLAVSTEAVVTINSFGLVLQFSRSATELWGYEEQEIVGQNVKVLCPPTHARKHDGYLRAYAQTGIKHVIGSTRELPTVLKEGQDEMVTARVAEVKTEGGSIFIALVTCAKEARELQKLNQYVTEVDRTMPIASITIKTNGDIAAMNGVAEKLLGYTKAEVMGRNVNMLMEPHFQEEHDRILSRYRKKGTDRDELAMSTMKRLKCQHKDGTVLHIGLSLSPLELYGHHTDKQELVAATLEDQSKLAELQQKITTVDNIANLAATAVVVINDVGIMQKFSRAAETLFGRTSDETLGHNVQILMSEPHHSKHPRYLDNYKKYGVSHVIDTTIMTEAVHSDGTQLHIELTVVETKQNAFVGFITDMVDEWRVQTLVKQNDTVHESSHFPMLTIDPIGTILSANKAAVATFGYDEEGLLGENVKILTPEEIAIKHDGYLEAYRRTGIKKIIGVTQHLRAKREDGSIFSIELRVRETTMEDKSVFVGCLRDLTELENMDALIAINNATIMHCGEPLIIINRYGIIDLFSENACLDFGYTHEEIIGKNISTVQHPEVASKHDGYLASYFKTGKKVMLDRRVTVEGRKKDGKSINLSSMITESCINGEVYFFAVLSDASGEDALQQEREVSEKVMMWSSPAIASMNVKGLVLDYNISAERLFKYPRLQIIGKNVKILMRREIAEKHDGYLASYLKTRKKVMIDATVEQKVVTAEGKAIPMEVCVKEILDDDGNPVKFVAYCRPLMEIKNMEFTKTMTDTMIEQSPVSIIGINGKGIMSRFSQAAERDFGYKAADIIGKNVSLIMTEEVRKRHDLYLEKYANTGVKKVIGKVTTGIYGRRQDGSTFPIELIVKEIKKEGLEPIFIGCLVDHTRALATKDQVTLGEAMASASILPLIVISEIGTIKQFSASAQALFGYCNIVGRNIDVLMPKRYAEAHAGYLQRYKTTRVKTVIDSTRTVQGLHKNGQEFDVLLMIREVIVDGTSTYFGYCRDLSVPRNLEWEGKLSELLCHGFDEPIVSIDKGGFVCRFNSAAENLFHFTSDQVLGRNVKILMPDDIAGRHDAYIEASVQRANMDAPLRKKSVTIERKDGSHLVCQLALREEKIDEECGFTARFYVADLNAF